MKTLCLILIFLSAPVHAWNGDDDDGDMDAMGTMDTMDAFSNGRNSPRLYAPDGTYLGNINNNPMDPNSISNPIGRYGNPISPDSVFNRLGRYGNPYSQQYSNPYVPRRLGQ